jgi:hypothetical protein
MKGKVILFVSFIITLFIFTSAYIPLVHKPAATDDVAAIKRYLYVAVPGIRDYLGYGGHGILVFDIDNNHHFVKRITTKGFHPDNTPSNVKGVAVSIPSTVFLSVPLNRCSGSTLPQTNSFGKNLLKAAATACPFLLMVRPCGFHLLKKVSGTWWIALPVNS